ncbi:MAG: alpha/beta hydrolase [Myxococcota bacterium]
MTLFLNFRTAGVGGGIVEEPYVLEGNGRADPVALRSLGWTIPVDRISGREVVFATHGFNVSYQAGAQALAQLETDLNLGPGFVFVGVLWPGDWWLPVINYPAEAGDAVRCGVLLAKFVNARLARARSVSLVSHSLGGRLVLEAVTHLAKPAREVCLLAAAVDDDCLSSAQYAAARGNAGRINVLASTRDLVLRLAYPAGDFVSDVGFDDDSPWRRALGYHGPQPEAPERVRHAQIDRNTGYGHGDYFPTYPPAPAGAPIPKSSLPERFVREALLGLPHTWP